MGKSKERVPVNRLLATHTPHGAKLSELRDDLELVAEEWSALKKIVDAARQRAAAFDMGLDLTQTRSMLRTMREHLLAGRTLGDFVDEATDATDLLHRGLLVIGCETAVDLIRNGERWLSAEADRSSPETAEILEALTVMEDQVWQGGLARRTRLGVWEQMVGEIYDWRMRFFPGAGTNFPIVRIVRAGTAELPDGFKPKSALPEAFKKAIAKARSLDRSLRDP
jgi:hypothetical protein